MQFRLDPFFGPDTPTKRSSETVTFPTGEVLKNEYWVSDGGIDGSESNKISFQETPSSPIEKWEPEDDSKLPVSQAKLIRYHKFLAMVAINQHIFEHCVERGESHWDEITWMGDSGAQNFIDSALRPEDLRRTYALQSNFDYWFDHVDFDHGVLVTFRHYPDDRFPRYLAYIDEPIIPSTSDTRSRNWHFDLDQTRTINGIQPPDDPGLVVDVSVIAGSPSPGGPTREDVLKNGGKEIFRQSFPVSSSNWTSIDFTSEPARAGQAPTPVHYEFRFGFQEASGHYTFRWRGGDFYETQYPSAPLGEWTWPCSYSGGLGREIVFYRARKLD